MADQKDTKEKKMSKPTELYKVTAYHEPESPAAAYERTLYADTNVNQARAIYHQADPIGEVTEIRWYCLDISLLEDDDPGTMPSTPTYQKPPAE
jgi:hypothetical protein